MHGLLALGVAVLIVTSVNGGGGQTVEGYEETTTVQTTATVLPTQADHTEHGYEVKNRRYVDSWTNAVYIPSPRNPIQSNGNVARWSFYARRTGLIYLQIWRKISHRYKLIGQQRWSVTRTGVQNVIPTSSIDVQSGDLLGFYFPGYSIIPFDGRECSTNRGYYMKRYFRSPLVTGRTYAFSTQQGGWNPCRQYSLKIGISGEANFKEFGYEVKNRRYIDSWTNAVYIPSPRYPIQLNGIVGRWSFYARRTGLIYLQIWRESSYRYKLIGQQRWTVTRTGVQNINPTSNIGVQRGDLLGFYFPRYSIIPFDGRECSTNRGHYMKRHTRYPLSVGHTYSFSTQQRGWNPCRQYSMKIFIYPEGQLTTISTQPPTTTLTYTEATKVETTTESYETSTEAYEATTNSNVNGSCCWKRYAGKALLGEVLSVVSESAQKCKELCCINDECRSFSASEIAGQIFCVLQSTASTSDSPLVDDPGFSHYDRALCP